MKNLKRALSMALASVMLFGMMVVGTGAASFTDVADTHNVEAIEVLKAAEIMIGDTDGNFNPDKAVTRNEAAVMMSNMLGLDAEDYAGTAPFTDVPAWAEAYVSACYANGIVSGTSATTYTGDATVTAAELGLMAQKALGYFKHASDFGDDWKLAAVKNASDIDLYDGINAGADTAMTRNDAAQLLLNALESKVVYDSVSGTATEIKGNDISVSITPVVKYYEKADSKNYDYNEYDKDDVKGDLYLIEKLYGADFTKVADDDKYGRPGYAWENKKNETIVFVADEALAVYGAEFDEDTMGDDFEDWKNVTDAEIVYNGGDAGLDLADLYEKNGYTIEVYGDADAEKIEKYVVTEAYAAEITAINTNDDEEVAEVELTVYEATTEYTITIDVEDDEDAYALVADYAEEDVLMVFLAPGWDGALDADKALKDVADVEVVEGKATAMSVDSWYNGWVKIDGVKYEFANEYSQNADLQVKADGAFYLFNGYVVHFDGEVGEADAEYVYVVRSADTEDKWGNFTYVSEVVYADGTSEIIDVKEEYAAGVYTYEYDEDEKYNVLTAADMTGVTASIEAGKTAIDGTNTANANTVYVVVTLDDGAFDEAKTYTGYKNVADLANGTVYSVADAGKPAKLVYVIDATATVSNDDLIFVSGASFEKYVDADLGTVYTYAAIVDGKITEITGNSNKYDGLYNAVVINDDGVYTKMTSEGIEYEIVVGEFKKAADEVVTIGGKALAYADDVVVYVIGTDGAITKGSITKNYSNGTDYTIKVMYTMNDDGEVDAIFIKKAATFNYTTEAELLAAADKAGMTTAVLTDTFGNRANVKMMAKVNGAWEEVFDVDSESWCGRNGTNDAKKEGDGCSPTGLYPMFLHFGTEAAPAGTDADVAYTQLTAYDHFWVDGEVNNSGLYNKFVVSADAVVDIDTIYGDYDIARLDFAWADDATVKAERASYGFNSCEWLWEETVAYAYSSSIEYNTNWVLDENGQVAYEDGTIVNGDGSCIFFHCESGNATAGCISIPEADFVTYLETIDATGAMIAIN